MNDVKWLENCRKERNDHAFYDHTRIISHLEKQAQEGWMLTEILKWEKWQYREIEPQKVHFAIIYGQSNDEINLSHYRLAARFKGMRIFYRTLDAPEPASIDAMQEVQAVHKQFLRRWLWTEGVPFVLVFLCNALMWGYAWQKQLSWGKTLDIFGMGSVMMFFLFIWQTVYFLAEGGYHHKWYIHAKQWLSKAYFWQRLIRSGGTGVGR